MAKRKGLPFAALKRKSTSRKPHFENVCGMEIMASKCQSPPLSSNAAERIELRRMAFDSAIGSYVEILAVR